MVAGGVASVSEAGGGKPPFLTCEAASVEWFKAK
jgi:hypothetical protein